MEKEMRKYELVVIVDVHLAQEEKDTIIKNISEVIAKEGGKVINSSVWFDKQKFTFPIKKKKEGTYYLINFEAAAEQIEPINGKLRLNETVLRFAIISSETPAKKETAKA